MRYRIELKADAKAEIKEAAAYIAIDSPQRAKAWLNGIYQTIFSLQEMPRRYGPAREDIDLNVGLRQAVYKSHRIVFDIRGETVRVFHVKHAARRIIDTDEVEPKGTE